MKRMVVRPGPPSEFKRWVRVDDLPPSGRSVSAFASACERLELAQRFAVAGVERLEVVGNVQAIRGGKVVQLTAHLSADVIQTCVVTLAPLHRHVDADLIRLYSSEIPVEEALGEEVFFDDEDDIEALVGNRIDVGEAAAEQLALELDSYPRAPGASLEQSAHADLGPAEGPGIDRSTPFADLDSWGLQRPTRNPRK